MRIQKDGEEMEIEVVRSDVTGNLWEQMKEMLIPYGRSSHDLVAFSLLPVMKNCYPFFAIDKRSGRLLGVAVGVETNEILYACFLIVRPELRGLGIGKLITSGSSALQYIIENKPVISRSVPETRARMLKKPYNYSYLYEVSEIADISYHKLMSIISIPTDTELTCYPIKELESGMFARFCCFDQYITGVHRRQFLHDCYNLPFTKGIILLDDYSNIHGYAGCVPTLKHNFYKIGPVFAENNENASILIKAVADLIHKENPSAHFAIHLVEGTAADWIVSKCHEFDIRITAVGSTAYARLIHGMGLLHRISYRSSWMYAPNSCPAHFDA